MKFYLITDTHFNHKKIIEFCDRPENYEQLLFADMNNIPEDGVLLHLGDICIGRDAEVHEQYIMPLKCKKWLVKGNHDRKSNTWYYNHGWDVVVESMSIIQGGKHIFFSHKPIVLPKTKSKYQAINIHGHFHNSDHRLYEPEMQRILTPAHKLLAIEYTNYRSVPLDKLLNKY